MYPVFDNTEYKRLLRRRFFEIPKRFFRDIKYSIQRIRKGYCDSDIWNIDCWFLHVMPDMLQQLKDTTHSYPVITQKDPDGNTIIVDDEKAEKQWDETLNRMIFLLKEANEETCTRKNPYEEEYQKVCEDFREKYGDFGENLDDGEELPGACKKMHFASELPENKGIDEKYWQEEQELDAYRNECKNQALGMFADHFWDLWD